MFSKKVEEFDELRQNLSVKERDLNCVSLDKTNLQDFHDKYEREYVQRDDLS